jgi:predicted transposase YbfD/YdcC
MLKNYLINSTIYCQKKNERKKEKKNFNYHLCRENQLNFNENVIQEKLIENKNRLQQIFIYFYQQIANGLDLFEIWANDLGQENNQILFQQ